MAGNNIFDRTRKKREEGAGLRDVNADKKKAPSGPSQADFLYGTSEDLKKKRKMK